MRGGGEVAKAVEDTNQVQNLSKKVGIWDCNIDGGNILHNSAT